MDINTANRKQVIQSLLGDPVDRLLDVGCGPIIPDYPYVKAAKRIDCLDWKIRVIDPKPDVIHTIEANFADADLEPNAYDTVIAADVFEHVVIEDEPRFAQKCFDVIKPGGSLIVSVPHAGTFGFIDPYQVKPTICNVLWRVGLYKKIHNGFCDIRKGHKHYTKTELSERFSKFEVDDVRYWGYFYDPALSWVNSLSILSPLRGYFRKACEKEFQKDYDDRSFNFAIKFKKPA